MQRYTVYLYLETALTCFGWYFHPSSEAHTTVSTASGICHTVTAICRNRGRVWNWFECAVGGVIMVIIIIIIVTIIIIIIIIFGISFMQGIYTYIPETNHVPREHRVATILM
jgi:hypothetical protein